jgi:hypothetical protein
LKLREERPEESMSCPEFPEEIMAVPEPILTLYLDPY